MVSSKLNFDNTLVFLVISAILSLVIPANGVLNGDEEMYFRMASDYLSSSLNSNSEFITNENSLNHRFLFNYICGILVYNFGYEDTHIIGRVIIISLFSLSLFSLFKYLNSRPIEIIFTLFLFLILHQTYYSELQLVKGFLASDFSYPISILSVVYMFKRKYLLALFLLVLATYFHFLIGGYFFLFFIVYFFINSNNRFLFFIYNVLYLFLISPLFFILIKSNLKYDLSVVEYDVNWIYSYVRHSHHLLPFKSYTEFINNWLPGIILSQILFFIVIFIHFKKLFIEYLQLSLYLIIGNVYLIVAFFISYFDHSFTLAKLYLFRPACAIFLLTLIFLTRFIFIKMKFYEFTSRSLINRIFLTLVLIFCFYFYNTNSRYKSADLSNKIEFIDFVKSKTNDECIFLFENSMIDFERLTGRVSFFSNKIIPTHALGIMEWYKRRLFYKKIFVNIEFVERHNIDYFVTKSKKYNKNFSNIIFENNDFVVYSASKN